jgi:hypothetical protein
MRRQVFFFIFSPENDEGSARGILYLAFWTSGACAGGSGRGLSGFMEIAEAVLATSRHTGSTTAIRFMKDTSSTGGDIHIVIFLTV